MAVLDDARGQQTLIATGGGAKNAYWLRLIASLTGCKIAVPKNTDIGAALGAARLAMLADKMTLAGVCTPPEVAYTIQPDAELAAKLAPAHQFSRQLYHLISKM